MFIFTFTDRYGVPTAQFSPNLMATDEVRHSPLAWAVGTKLRRLRLLWVDSDDYKL